MARQVADQTAYAAGYRDPVRAINPMTPTQTVVTGGKPTLPIVGIVALVAVVLVVHHLERRRRR